MKRSSTTSVSRFFLETLVVASNDAGLAKATIDLGRSDVGRRYVGLDPSLPIVLSCAGMRSPRRPKLRSPCCAYDEGRDYWDLATLEIQPFRPMRCSRAQAGRLPHHLRARHARCEWQAEHGAPTCNIKDQVTHKRPPDSLLPHRIRNYVESSGIQWNPNGIQWNPNPNPKLERYLGPSAKQIP